MRTRGAGGYDVFAAIVFHAIPGDGSPGAAGNWDYSLRLNASELRRYPSSPPARSGSGAIPMPCVRGGSDTPDGRQTGCRGRQTSPWAGSRTAASPGTQRRTCSLASSRCRCWSTSTFCTKSARIWIRLWPSEPRSLAHVWIGWQKAGATPPSMRRTPACEMICVIANASAPTEMILSLRYR
jgi:hypothetical protein